MRHLFKIDLSRAYRQLRSCPLDWPLLGISWGDAFFVDRTIPFGLRHGASACQRTTEAVAEIAAKDKDISSHPYIDDTAAAALPLLALDQYHFMLGLMEELGLIPALNKCVPPSTTLTWIGVTYNSLDMTMAIASHKVREAAIWCVDFLSKSTVSHKFMERLLGKVFHAIKCADGARRFTSRLLQLLTTTAVSPKLSAPVTHEARLDALWLAAFLPAFNGITLIKPLTAQFTVEVDSCLSGGGGICEGVGFFAVTYPPSIVTCDFPIAALECLNLLISLRLWCDQWRGKHVLLFCDNWSVVCALQSGRAREPLIQGALREIWWLAALNDIELTVRHKPGSELVTADALSRLATSADQRLRFQHILLEVPQFHVPHALLSPPLPI